MKTSKCPCMFQFYIHTPNSLTITSTKKVMLSVPFVALITYHFIRIGFQILIYEACLLLTTIIHNSAYCAWFICWVHIRINSNPSILSICGTSGICSIQYSLVRNLPHLKFGTIYSSTKPNIPRQIENQHDYLLPCLHRCHVYIYMKKPLHIFCS